MGVVFPFQTDELPQGGDEAERWKKCPTNQFFPFHKKIKIKRRKQNGE
jgi:hypothetical protein